MKAIPFKVSHAHEDPIKAEFDDLEQFYGSLHTHPEYQLTWIKQSTGTLYLGNQITPFQQGDIFLIGKNVPHVFRNDQSSQWQKAQAYSLYFKEDFTGETMLHLPMYQRIVHLYNLASLGLRPGDKAANQLKRALPDFLHKDVPEKIGTLLLLLLQIESAESNTILSEGPVRVQMTDDQRIQKVFDFIIENYPTDIGLDAVASMANLSPTSFCRFFKQRTRKTFSRYLTEVRVEAACQLLRNGNPGISQVCYDTGFHNLSNFNRHFKRIVGVTPSIYSRSFREKTDHQLALSPDQ